jgi:hypothetical protein
VRRIIRRERDPGDPQADIIGITPAPCRRNAGGLRRFARRRGPKTVVRVGVAPQPMKVPSEVGATPRASAPALRIATAFTLATFYCVAFIARPPTWLPKELRNWAAAPSAAVRSAIRSALAAVGQEQAHADVRMSVYLIVTAAIVPWLIMSVLGAYRPRDLGIRPPNRLGIRLLLVCFVVSVPFVWWMARGSGMAAYYLPHLKRSGAAWFLGSYLANMLTEHFLFHGAILAALRGDLRWPAFVSEGAVSPGVLRWLGVAQPTDGAVGLQRAMRWLGLPDGCLFAVLGSAFLFFLVHVGKDSREMVLSLGGGAASAWLAYRTNSCVTPFLLHVATAGATLGLMLLLH